MTSPNGHLSRADILGMADVKTEEVYVPEWSGSVRVRGLSAWERDEFEQSLLEGRGTDRSANLSNMRAKLVAATLVDTDGMRLFSDEDAFLLGQRSAAAIARIWDVAQRLSGMSRRDVEDIAGNSSTTVADASSIA